MTATFASADRTAGRATERASPSPSSPVPAAQRLQRTMAAARVSFTWLGVRKALSPQLPCLDLSFMLRLDNIVNRRPQKHLHLAAMRRLRS